MANRLFLFSSERGSRQAVIASDVLAQFADRKPAFFKPIIPAEDHDEDIAAITAHFALTQTFAESYAYTAVEARDMVNAGKTDALLDGVLQKFTDLEKKHNFILCMGLDPANQNSIFAFDLNTTIAANLSAPVLLLADGAGKDSREIIASILLTRELAKAKPIEILACIINNADQAQADHTAVALSAAGIVSCSPPDSFTFQSIELTAAVDAFASTVITPKMFEYKLIERAKSKKMRIVLPEGEEERILRAAEILQRREVAEIILLGDAQAVREKMDRLGIVFTGAVIQPDASPEFNDYIDTYAELRKAKNITREQAIQTMRDNTYYGTMMVYKGHADGMVSGAINTTAHTIRPAFEFIKTKPGVSIVSSLFLMCMKDRVLAFGDCAVNPNPTPEQLAGIAITSSHTAKMFGIAPRVAMLSYSTGDSGKGPDVDMVVEAVKLAREQAPELIVEGPIQYDAAIAPDVGRTKLPDSQVAGQATVFIFPDLNTGNNTYKAVQRSANAVAVGPVLQGMNKPVNDLSRGCTVADIVNTVAITAVQAQAEQ